MLASDSEAIVKAERAKAVDIKEMQEETVICLKEEGCDDDVATKDRDGHDDAVRS